MQKLDNEFEPYTGCYVNYPVDTYKTQLVKIFKGKLLESGFKIRKNQIHVSLLMFNSMMQGHIALCEAEVGTGKTHAYLIASLLYDKYNTQIKRFGFYNDYDDDDYLDRKKTILISTSNKTLQKALLDDYLPQLSNILLKESLIGDELTAVIRKGKDNYICDKRLGDLFLKQNNDSFLEDLMNREYTDIDLDEINISKSLKEKICVMNCSGPNCELYSICRFRQLMKHYKGEFDFQICNHNYFLADIKHRTRNIPALLNDYSAIIIDEAHKLEEVARDMYGDTISKNEVNALTDVAKNVLAHHYDAERLCESIEYIQKCNRNLFSGLKDNIIIPEDCKDADEIEKHQTVISDEFINYMKDMRIQLEFVNSRIETQGTMGNNKNDKTRELFNKISALIEKFKVFTSNLGNLIYWLEDIRSNKIKICCIPKNLDKKLQTDIFSKGIPIVLTSGTMSVNKDFDFLKNKLGLNSINNVHEMSVSSPFNFMENCRIYLPDDMPYPDYDNTNYTNALSQKVKDLIEITNGKTIVLFTSYTVLNIVYNNLSYLQSDFEFIKSVRSDTTIVNRFKSGQNAVLFATGSCWEGIDIPGDKLSSIIIVKLPFPVPDPILTYKKTLINSDEEFMNQVLFPEMIIKLRQGFGRLIRDENDTGIVSILDSRMNIGKKYRENVLKCLPDCFVSNSFDEIRGFLHAKKSKSFFKNGSEA